MDFIAILLMFKIKVTYILSQGGPFVKGARARKRGQRGEKTSLFQPSRFGSQLALYPVAEIGAFVSVKKPIIRTHLLSEKGSDYMGLVPVAGLEPARLAALDFEFSHARRIYRPQGEVRGTCCPLQSLAF
ncbi:MAG: hypothetical protein K2O11_07370 [Oscillospiraceae bacterium]|nr:hypothetical protein [Oscillospiraceae bacterium]